MTEKLHQSLSSIMDAAGDDLELPRLLSAMQESPELERQMGDKWRRYHLAQGIMQGDLRGLPQAQAAQVDISTQVMQQLEMETMEAPSTPEVTQRSDKAQWFRGGALAASVALLVITGVQVFNASRDAVQPGSVPVATQQQPVQQEQAVRQQVAQPSGALNASDFNGPILQVSSSPRSPFAPEAFTGRSLVNYATGQQSRQEANTEHFSPAASR